MYCFFYTVVSPAQQAEAAAKNSPRGNLSDLYPRWLGTRELLLNGRDPYSAELTADFQKGVWGRAIDPRNPNDPRDETRFAYPLHIVFLLLPTIVLPFYLVQVLFIGLVLIASVASVWFWVRSFGHAKPALVTALGSIFLLGSYPFVLALRVQQPSLIVLPLIAGVMMAINAELLWVGGVLLAFATIKPQLVIGIVAWLMLWTASNWKDRKALLISFTLVSSAMLIGSELLLPGWFWKWRDGLSAYAHYAPAPGAYVELLFGKMLGKIIGSTLALGICTFCWKSRNATADSDRFKLAPVLILTGTLLVNPVWRLYDLVFLFPSALLLFHWRHQFSRLKPLQRAILIVFGTVLAWQWPAAALVSVIGAIAPQFAWSLQILPWLSIFLITPLAMVSLVLVGHARLSSSLEQ